MTAAQTLFASAARPHISVVVPVYKGEERIDELYRRLVTSLERLTLDFEIVLVEDCGGDGSWPAIVRIAAGDKRVCGIQFSRNFGQHPAITAGLDHCSGEWVVVMDCDLQDQPEEIPKLYAKAQQGFDVVVGRRYQRKDKKLKKLGSTLFYLALNYMTDRKNDAAVANFGIYSRKVIESVNLLREQNRFFPLAVRSVGFVVAEVDIEHASRSEGESTYNFRKLANLAVNSIVAHSNKPLRFSIMAGFAMSLLSMLVAGYLTLRYFFQSTPVEGWTSVIVSLYFIAGLILANMGVLGLYLGKIFDETKARPLYIVRQKVGFSHLPVQQLVRTEA